MPKEDDVGTETTGGVGGLKVIRANNVEIPVTGQPRGLTAEENADLLKLRSSFFAGERLQPDDMNRMVKLSMEGGGGNGNCGIC